VDGYHQRTPLPDTEREHIIQEMAAFGGKLQALEQHMRPQPWMKILCFTWAQRWGANPEAGRAGSDAMTPEKTAGQTTGAQPPG
jgi:hypothetical protein